MVVLLPRIQFSRNLTSCTVAPQQLLYYIGTTVPSKDSLGVHVDKVPWYRIMWYTRIHMAYPKSTEKPRKIGVAIYERHRLMVRKLAEKRKVSNAEVVRESIEEKFKRDA